MTNQKKVNRVINAKSSMIIFIISNLFLLHCWSCKDKEPDQVVESPEITDLTVSEITETTAKCTFSISLAGTVQKAGVIYDPNSSLPEDSPEVTTTNIANGNISLMLTDLSSNTYYYYKAYITTSEGTTINSTLYLFKTEPPPLEVSTALIEVEFQEATFHFDVFSKLEWNITSNQSWCTVEPSTGDGNTEISVSVTENLTGGARSATLTVTAENLTRQVIIEQSFPTLSTIEPEMVFVQGGDFMMGCTSDDCYDDEMPAHQVSVSDFYIGKYEVTQAQWRVVMGVYPSYFTGDSLPVENVSWNEVQEYISRLNNLTGKKYRLLTEAEWEFAARGGNSSKGFRYSGGNDIESVAWYWNNIPSQTRGDEGYGTQTAGLKSPNELGIYDMSGNVLEWCGDWYGEYDSDTQTDPTGPVSGTYRVVRGGGWNSGEKGVTVTYRGFIAPDLRYNYLGFRLGR